MQSSFVAALFFWVNYKRLGVEKMRKKAKKMSEILSEMTTMNYDTLKQYQQKILEKIRTSDGDTKR